MKTQTRDLKLLHVRIPRLTSKMVKAGTRLPQLADWKAALTQVVESVEIARPAPVVAEPKPEPFTGKKSGPTTEAVTVPVDVEPEPEFPSRLPRDVPVKVIPTPKKRHSRTVEVAAEPVVPEEPRPLKIIRRRREEEPKVFETTAKLFPKAMLEGVKSSVDQNGENLPK